MDLTAVLAGQHTDPETGLIYLRARYYDPVTGQFDSRSPLVAVSDSAYGYGQDDPLNTTDPSGLLCVHIPFTHDHCNSIWKQHPGIHAPLIAAVAVPLAVAGAARVVATAGICAGVTPGIAAAVAGGSGTAAAAASQVSSDATLVGEVNGPATVIPAGAAGPTPCQGDGVQYVGGSGGPGLDSRVTNVRVMDMVMSRGLQLSSG